MRKSSTSQVSGFLQTKYPRLLKPSTQSQFAIQNKKRNHSIKRHTIRPLRFPSKLSSSVVPLAKDPRYHPISAPMNSHLDASSRRKHHATRLPNPIPHSEFGQVPTPSKDILSPPFDYLFPTPGLLSPIPQPRFQIAADLHLHPDKGVFFASHRNKPALTRTYGRCVDVDDH